MRMIVIIIIVLKKSEWWKLNGDSDGTVRSEMHMDWIGLDGVDLNE